MEYLTKIGKTLTAGAVVALMSTALPASADDLKIGILTGLTGGYGPWGEAGLNAAKVAAAEINAAGGVNGGEVVLSVADNQSGAEGSVVGWKRLVEVSGVSAVAGLESDGAVALLDESSAAQVPIMCPACGTPKLATMGGDYVWRFTGGDDDLGVIMAQIALDRTKSVAVMTQLGLEATEGISKVFIPSFGNGGGEVAADIRFSGELASFRGELEKAFAASEHVVISTDLEVGTRLLTEYLRRDYGGTLYLIPELIANEVAGLGSGALDGVAFGVSPSYDFENPAFKSFATAFNAATGTDPSPAMYEPNYYDQIIVLALAAQAAASNDGAAIRDNLANIANPPGKVVYSYADGLAALKAGEDIAYYGASGAIDFNEFGNVGSFYGEVTPKNGGWAELRAVELDPSLR
ncbi:MAG: ABC transporter substrate-binding protein [Paracoccaceae bacterium]|nr:ABC transporter substrate-binding protein [Paracoccaceae bacterium]